MKHILILMIGIVFCGAAHAAGCPTGFEEIPLENIQVTTGDETCAANFEKYYEIDKQCTAHILD